MRLGLDILQQVLKRKNDLRLYADELGKGLVGELDYTLEAANAVEFMEAHSAFPSIRVPKVFQNLTQKRVLTMEWMNGENPKELLFICNSNNLENESQYSEKQRTEAKRHLLDLVNKGVEACLVQLIETGLLHADPHPGNMLYLPSGQIGFLDFGLICRMEKKHKFAMLGSIIHIVNGDWKSLVGSLVEMDVVRPGTNLSRVTMELEYAMDEVEFNDGIPDVRFSKVLGKVFSIALKYHFRMPPYYTLLLRSLASFEGLAMAGDPNFNTFEDSYPYVVRKLLTDNSLDTRKILHAVVLNKRKELQWKKVAFFLRVGANSKGLQLTSKSETSSEEPSNRVSDTVNLALKLLLSKDGAVVRRLVITADGTSLIRGIVSKEARPFRYQISKIIADMIYQSICTALGNTFVVAKYGAIYASSLTPAVNYQSLVKNRRLRVIFLKVLESGRKNPVLMARLYWVSFVTLVAASAIACHRLVVSLSEAYLGRLSFGSKKLAVSNS
ncbi:protein ACTIVITY OF BC1 COMPLEX KINASE 3, chloroplastic-like [Bidens hawaiensis]|uniref:protein ACTIVITY OF BC1 COMPLEX KINASE 3, chloroplastic-like n=1 Tax=Bidens hawaiensis TaxID=980011 RepID=UPI004049FEB7